MQRNTTKASLKTANLQTILILNCCLGVAVYSEPAFAKDDSSINISQGVVFDDNPNNQSNGEADSIIGSETRLSYIYDKETPASSFDAKASLARNQFNDSDFNSTDYGLASNYERETQRWTFGVGGSADYDTTRDIDVTEIDVVTESDNRLTLRAGPSISYAISERSRLALNADWQEKIYENDDLTDHRVFQATTSLGYKLTPNQSVSASVLGRRYATQEGEDREVDSVGSYLGWNYRFSPRYSLALSAGALGSNFTGYTGVDEDEWEINPVYSASLNYRGQQNKASLGVERSREASPLGTEYDQTVYTLQNLFTINPLWSLNTSVKYRYVEETGIASSGLDQSINQAAALNYDMDSWRASLSQRYVYKDISDGDESQRNLIKLSLSYRFGDNEEN